MEVQMQLGGQIRRHREVLGLSQDQLARRIFVSRQTVSNWELGRTYPDVQNLLLLSDLFGVTIDVLVKGDLETMNREIKRNGQRLMAWYVVMWAVLGFVSAVEVMNTVSGFEMARSPWWINNATGIIAACGLLAVAMWCNKLNKDADIVTFNELQAYLAGERVDRSARRRRLLVDWKGIGLGVLVALLSGGLTTLLAFAGM